MHLGISSVWFIMLVLLALYGQQQYQLWLALALIMTFAWDRAALKIIFSLPLTGICIDWLLSKTHFVVFEPGGFPLWLLMLWLALSWYLWQWRSYLARVRVLHQMLCGFIAGLLFYALALSLDTLYFPQGTWQTLLLLALWWTLLLPLMVRCVLWLNAQLETG
ncbi:DUF2878 family protein [Dongshaea marina]|uniref:DUF2878 family protein n=1 Tax=Dongshaea marina TaxID=2047966 RepID=UPI00131EEE31|nr:DUF2878 family protein [Dongshaea marina]